MSNTKAAGQRLPPPCAAIEVGVVYIRSLEKSQPLQILAFQNPDLAAYYETYNAFTNTLYVAILPLLCFIGIAGYIALLRQAMHNRRHWSTTSDVRRHIMALAIYDSVLIVASLFTYGTMISAFVCTLAKGVPTWLSGGVHYDGVNAYLIYFASVFINVAVTGNLWQIVALSYDR